MLRSIIQRSPCSKECKSFWNRSHYFYNSFFYNEVSTPCMEVVLSPFSSLYSRIYRYLGPVCGSDIVLLTHYPLSLSKCTSFH